MKICLYSPYIPTTFGGGEKHLLDIATVLSKKNSVTLAVSEKFKTQNITSLAAIQKQYESFYGQSLDSIKFEWSPLGVGSTISNFLWTAQFDSLFYVTDGSLFFSGAKSNYLHVQIPFTHSLSALDTLKLKIWKINTNSEFTKKIIESAWKVSGSKVLYPKVSLEEFSKTSKKPIILSVGRFFRQLHAKRQDVLIDAFALLQKKLSAKEKKEWQLLLVGSVEDQEYLKELKIQASGLNVKFLHQVSRQDLIEIYNYSSLYWHAAGYEVDQEKHPEAAEHFGIAIIEALAAGDIPIAYNGGGVPEILTKDSGLQSLLWKTQSELVSITKDLISNDSKRKTLAKDCKQRSSAFGKDRFEKEVYELFS